MQTINDRVMLVVKILANGKQVDLCKKTGIAGGTLNNIVGKKQNNPSFETLEKICIAYPELNRNWFFNGVGNIIVSNATVVQFANDNDMLHDIVVSVGRSARKFRYAQPSVVGCCYYLFAEKNYEKAGEFINSLISGAGLENNSPVFVVRKKLEMSHNKKLSEKDLKFLLITGWNYFINDKPCKEIRITSGSKMPDIEG